MEDDNDEKEGASAAKTAKEIIKKKKSNLTVFNAECCAACDACDACAAGRAFTFAIVFYYFIIKEKKKNKNRLEHYNIPCLVCGAGLRITIISSLEIIDISLVIHCRCKFRLNATATHGRQHER